jgi:hypothetical protein
MNVPPLFVDLRVAQQGHRPFHVWLPAFLLWPLAAALGALALAVAALMDAAAVASGGRPRHATALVLGVFAALTAARGTELDIDNATTAVHLTVH